MPRVVLLRHARSVANAEGLLVGRLPGIFLDEQGSSQADLLVEQLGSLNLTAVVRSPLERTALTIKPFLDKFDLPEHVDERFTECDYGNWSGLKLSELAKDPLWKNVQAKPSTVTFPDGESMAAMASRAVAGIAHWNQTLNANYLVVSHGDVIKAILADALGMKLDDFQRIDIRPASISVVDYGKDSTTVNIMNFTGTNSVIDHLREQQPAATTGGGDSHVPSTV